LGNLNISRKLSVIVTTTTKKIKIKSLRISYLSNFWNLKKLLIVWKLLEASRIIIINDN